MYKIGDFSKKINIPVKTLRYYDEIDLFKPSYIDVFTGYRYYENKQLSIINIIIQLKDINLSLNEIKEYLITKDINIIINKKTEYIMKVEKIMNYIDNINYEIKEGSYDEYIKWCGMKEIGRPIALELKDGTSKYYMVFRDGEYYSDFYIFPKENNLINLNIIAGFKNYYKEALKYIKTEFKYITLRIDLDLYGNVDYITKDYKVLSTKEFKVSGNNNEWTLTDITIEL